MVLIKIEKSLEEQKPVLVSGCLKLIGKDIDERRIENCLIQDNFKQLTLEDILAISSYSSVVEFIEGCKESNYRSMTGTLAITLCNFILRKISISQSFIKSSCDPATLQIKLDTIFYKATEFRSINQAIRFVYKRLKQLDFLASDMNAFLYLIVNYYLYLFSNSIVVFSDNSIYNKLAEETETELDLWISELGD